MALAFQQDDIDAISSPVGQRPQGLPANAPLIGSPRLPPPVNADTAAIQRGQAGAAALDPATAAANLQHTQLENAGLARQNELRQQATSDRTNEGDNVLSAISEARGNTSGWSTGLGAMLAPIPATPAHDLRSNIDTITANIGFDRLQAMRNASPTGGALGQVSDFENRMLQSSLTSLQQSQSEHQFRTHLDDVERHYLNVLNLINGQPPGNSTEEARSIYARAHGGQSAPSAPVDPNQAQPGERATSVDRAAMAPDAAPQAINTSGATRLEEDPVLRGVGNRVGAMVARGAPDDQILGLLQQSGVSPGSTSQVGSPAWILAFRAGRVRSPDGGTYRQWRQQNPRASYPIDRSFYTRDVPQDTTSRVMSNVAAGPVGAYSMEAGNALMGNRLPSVVGAMGGNEEEARSGIQGVRDLHPYAALAGDVSGAAMAYELGGRALNGVAGSSAGGAVPNWLRAGAGRQVAGDTAYGAYSGSGQNGMFDPSGIPLGVAANVGGGMAGRGAARGIGRTLAGSRDAATRLLTDRGIPLTVGQIAGQGGRAGRLIENLENTATSVPGLGPTINAQRGQGLQQFNRATFEDVLRPIGGTREHLGPTAELAVEDADRQISAAFQRATNGVTLTTDGPFTAQFGQASAALRSRAVPKDQRRMLGTAYTQINDLFQSGQLSGENLHGALRLLADTRAAIAHEPLNGLANASLRQAEAALTSMAHRQAPAIMPALNRARQSYRLFTIARNSVSTAINNPGGGGEFTPAQLGRMARQGTINYGGRTAAASTGRPFFELQRAGQQVLPNTYPDSGTAGRLLAPMLALGAVGTGQASDAAGYSNHGAEIGLGLGALSLPYTNIGRGALQAALARRYPWLRGMGDALLDSRIPRLSGRIAAPALGHYTAERP